MLHSGSYFYFWCFEEVAYFILYEGKFLVSKKILFPPFYFVDMAKVLTSMKNHWNVLIRIVFPVLSGLSSYSLILVYMTYSLDYLLISFQND